MIYTSSEAAKLLRSLNEEYNTLKQKEQQRYVFVAAVGEDIESVRPSYEYGTVQKQLENLEQKIRIVKHTINRFNLKTLVPDFDMTIDQMLVYIPQLTARKEKLARMVNRLPKQRENTGSYRTAPIIEYSYANYDMEEVEQDYKETAALLAKAQTALDLVNNTQTMEIEL